MKSIVLICVIVGATSSFADGFKPIDALDEAVVGISARFVPIKAGEFQMGSHEDEESREKNEVQHLVKLTKDYEMQVTAVTQLQYFIVTGRNPSHFRKKESCDENNYQVYFGLALCAHHPVESLTWDHAQRFIAELNKIQNNYTYRLPTEAEREYATRGGKDSVFPYSFGFNDTGELSNHGWFEDNSEKRTHAVALKNANPYGLYDLHGNVQEWVQDFWGDYSEEAVTDPTGPEEGRRRVTRGGGWDGSAGRLRSAFRGGREDAAIDTGFRLVRQKR